MKSLLSKEIVVNWLISKSSMSPKKLQKMLYYEYSWCLALFNSTDNICLQYELFPAKFQAWIHGPVIPDVYQEFKEKGFNDSGNHDIPKDTKLSDMDSKVLHCLGNNKNNESKKILQAMLSIFNAYKGYTGTQLAYMTHQDAPWKEARRDLKPFTPSKNVLSNQIIYDYYSKLLES